MELFYACFIKSFPYPAKNAIICKTKRFILKPEIIICWIWKFFLSSVEKNGLEWRENVLSWQESNVFFVSQSLYYWICHWFSSQSDSVSHLVAEKPSIIFYVYWCLLDHNDQTAASRNEPENTISDVWVGVSWKRQYALNAVLL